MYGFINKALKNSSFLFRLALKVGLEKFPDEFRVWKKTADVDFRKAWDLTEALLMRLNDSVRETGIKLAVICERNGVTFINPQGEFLRISEKIKSRGNRLYFRRDGHWNADGHALVANILFSYIEGQGF